MQITFNAIVVILGVFSIAVSAAQSTTEPEEIIRLRAWRDSRNTVYPFSLFVEVDKSTGNAIINKTAGYSGFGSFIKRTSSPPSGRPEGGLYSNDIKGSTTYRGYLFPLGRLSAPNTTAMHYQLKFSKRIPKVAGVLYTNFTQAGRGCGGHCGGLTLDHDLDNNEETYGDWYVIKEKKGRKGKQYPWWNLRWIAPRDKPATGEFYPPGSLPVYVWAERWQ